LKRRYVSEAVAPPALLADWRARLTYLGVVAISDNEDGTDGSCELGLCCICLGHLDAFTVEKQQRIFEDAAGELSAVTRSTEAPLVQLARTAPLVPGTWPFGERCRSTRE